MRPPGRAQVCRMSFRDRKSEEANKHPSLRKKGEKSLWLITANAAAASS